MERRLSTTSDSSTDSRNKWQESFKSRRSSADSDGAQGRVPKAMAPKVAVNPLQFVKVGPCDLYRSAQEQLKKVEEIKKSKKVCKDEGEDWQSNLDNWKCSRRKIQEHIIERVVEVKKYELADHERNRRKSKTFNEMMQERITKGRKTSLPVFYDDDAANDLSDLGLSSSKPENLTNGDGDTENEKESGTEKIEENGVEKSGEMTEDGKEYTYEWAIQSYVNFAENRVKSKSTTAINEDKKKFHPPVAVKPSEKVEGYLKNLQNNNKLETKSIAVPKVNINSKREMFEKMKETSPRTSPEKVKKEIPSEPLVKNRLMNIEAINKTEIPKIKEEIKKVVIEPSLSLKERMNSLQQSVNKEIPKQDITTNSSDEQTTHERSQSPDEMKRHYRHRSLDSLDIDENISGSFERVQSLEDLDYRNYPPSTFSGDTDREDSGIHTADVSSSVSQADDYDLHLDNLDDVKANHQPPIEEETKFDEKFDFEEIEKSNLEINSHNFTISNQKISEQDQTKNEILLNTPEIPKEIICEIESVNTSTIVMEAMVQYDKPEINEVHQPQFNGADEQFRGIIMDVYSDAQQECLFNLNPITMEPPKEKPPPPPIDISDDEEEEKPTKIPLRRLDSTKRIKKEIRQKRSSFLGIEGSNDDSYLEPELELVRPPDMTALLTEERRLERQLYRQSVCSESDSNQESRDSGVELDNKMVDTWSHSRNDSEVYGTQSTNSEEDEIMKKEREIIEALEQEEKIRKQDLGEKLAMRLRELEAEKHRFDWTQTQEPREYCNYKDEKVQKEEILREKRPDTIYLPETVQTQWSQRVQEEPVNRRANVNDIQYRKSMQDLTHMIPNHLVPIPYDNLAHRRSMPNLQEVVQRRPPPPPPPEKHTNIQNQMTKQKLQAISAAPRSKLISNDTWQAKRKQQKPEYNYQHWLIQEAEHRRITEQQQRTNHPCNKKWPNGHYYPDNRQNRPAPNKKPLPDSIIQTLTQRVQRMNSDNNNNRRRVEMHHTEPHYPVKDSKDKMLSVSGKKRCSHCGDELGRGAAMIIESLQLFYHIDCFKCCVCCLQLGDGLMGTDVRVRNNKLHCHNCYSSDDGAKFSCV